MYYADGHSDYYCISGGTEIYHQGRCGRSSKGLKREEDFLINVEYILETERVRIIDIAEEFGLSTATVSNVIYGKTKKISDETVKRVQERLEERQYFPGIAGILLGQNIL